MNDCLLVPMEDNLIIASDMNYICVSVDHEKLYFEIPERFRQILHSKMNSHPSAYDFVMCGDFN